MYDVMCCTLTSSKLRQGRLAQSGCDESERRTAAPPCPFHDTRAAPLPGTPVSQLFGSGEQ